MSLYQFFVILWARKMTIIIAVLATISAAVAVIKIFPPRFEATATVMLETGDIDPVSGEGGTAFLRTQQRSQMAVLQSMRTALDVVKRLDLSHQYAFVQAFREAGSQGDIATFIARALLENIDPRPVVESGSETNMMSITYRATDPASAAQIANAFLDSFLAMSLELKTSPLRRDAQWYDGQNKQLHDDLEKAQNKLSEFEQKNGLIGRSDQYDVEASKLKTLADQIVQTKGLASADEAALRELRAVWPDGTPAPIEMQLPASATNPAIEKLKESLANTLSDIAKQSGQLGENHPQLKAMQTTAADLKLQLKREYESARNGLITRVKGEESQIDALQKAYADQNKRVLEVQTQRDQLDILQKEFEQKQTELTAAEQRASAAKLQSQRTSLNVMPVDQAVPPEKPVFPKPLVIMPLSVVLGGVLGIALAMLREALDRRVRVSSDIELATGAEMLGAILPAPPRLKRKFMRKLTPPPKTVLLPGSAKG